MAAMNSDQSKIRVHVGVLMDREMERSIRVISARLGISKSEWIRLAVKDAIGRHAKTDTKTKGKS